MGRHVHVGIHVHMHMLHRFTTAKVAATLFSHAYAHVGILAAQVCDGQGGCYALLTPDQVLRRPWQAPDETQGRLRPDEAVAKGLGAALDESWASAPDESWAKRRRLDFTLGLTSHSA